MACVFPRNLKRGPIAWREAVTFGATAVDVGVQWLAGIDESYRIEGWLLDVAAVIDTGTAGAQGYDLWRIVNRLTISDSECGQIVDVSGEEIRDIMAAELRGGFYDPADVAASQTDAARRWTMFIPYRLPQLGDGASPLDVSIPVAVMRKGRINLSFGVAAPTDFPANTVSSMATSTVRVGALIRKRSHALPNARMVYKSVGFDGAERTIAVGGALRWALLRGRGDAAASGYSTWAAVVRVSVPELEISEERPEVLRDWARWNVLNTTWADVEAGLTASLDPWGDLGAGLPLLPPEWNGNIGDCPVLDAMKVRIDALPAGDAQVVLMSVITDRDASYTARAIGAGSEGVARTTVETEGKIGNMRYAEVAPELRSKLPVSLPG